MGKSLITKTIALTGIERLETFICMRINPTKDGEERKKRKLIRSVLRIPQSNVLVREGLKGTTLIIGRTVNKLFHRERELDPDQRQFEITTDLAGYLVDKISKMEAEDAKADRLADLEEKLVQVRDGRYECPDVPELSDGDYVDVVQAKRDRIEWIREDAEFLAKRGGNPTEIARLLNEAAELEKLAQLEAEALKAV